MAGGGPTVSDKFCGKLLDPPHHPHQASSSGGGFALIPGGASVLVQTLLRGKEIQEIPDLTPAPACQPASPPARQGQKGFPPSRVSKYGGRHPKFEATSHGGGRIKGRKFQRLLFDVPSWMWMREEKRGKERGLVGRQPRRHFLVPTLISPKKSTSLGTRVNVIIF